MSVFKAREWWATQCGDSCVEELGSGCMAVGNIDNESGGSAKVAVGTFSGILRIYKPSQRDFRAEDLKVEQQLGAPILQLEIGAFCSHPPGHVQLAVLQPKRLCVYSVTLVVEDAASGGGYYQLSLMYKHNLARSAFNFTFGPFGRADGRDYMAVQSLDGELTIIEQETIAFSKFLPNFLVPGPICYCPHPVDGFITVNSQMECECFRYSSLSASSSGQIAAPEDKEKENKRAKPEWSTIIGESAYEIVVARHGSWLQGSSTDIIILGEHTLFWLDKSGQLRAQKRLDYIPTCIATYPVVESSKGSGPTHNLIVGTATGSMMVYNHEMHLIWAAQLPTIPVSISICSVGKLRGLVASVGDAGMLSLCYMGTDPPQQVVSTSEKNELNYDAMDDEHRRLLSMIRDATSERRSEPSDQLVMRAQMPTALDEGHGPDRGWSNVQLTVKLFMSYTGTETIDQVTITISVPPPFAVAEPCIVLTSVGGGGTPRTESVVFTLASNELPTDRVATITALYFSKNGDPRTSTSHITLPLTMCGKAVPPTKSNPQHKITLDTNKNAPPLAALFEDIMSRDEPSAQANALSFMCHSGDEITVLVSKNSGRYRIQSECFEALWVLSHELAKRLSTHFASMGGELFEMSFSEELPLSEYFDIMDHHFAARQALQETHKALADRAHQFRATQKRLIVRFKDRNPAPLSELDALLTKTYESLMETAEEGEKQEEALRVAARRLSAATQLILLLIRYRFGLEDEMYKLIESHWTYDVKDSLQHGWEETTQIAITYLLKTVLSKSSKDATASLPQGPITPLQDIEKLKKQMSLVVDRLSQR